MRDIKRKLLAITLICAMSLSMAACNDGKEGIITETLSSEEAEQLKRVEFSIEDFTEGGDIAQDPIEGVELNIDNYKGEDKPTDNNNDNSSGNNNDNNNNNNDGNNSNNNDNNGGNNNNNNSNSGGNNNNNNNSGGNNNNNNSNNSGGNNNNNNSNNSGGNNNNNNSNSDGNNNNNNSNNNTNSSGNVSGIQGTEVKKQSFWMDLSGDFVFDGEFITATFKIKDTTPNGTYPILIKWLDFSNIQAVSLDATGIDGSVVVGGNATETQFKNDGSFEVKADSVSGNPGDTVTVSFRFKNNPGICASVFRFSYDSDALEYVSGVQGADFANALSTQNK